MSLDLHSLHQFPSTTRDLNDTKAQLWNYKGRDPPQTILLFETSMIVSLTMSTVGGGTMVSRKETNGGEALILTHANCSLKSSRHLYSWTYGMVLHAALQINSIKLDAIFPIYPTWRWTWPAVTITCSPDSWSKTSTQASAWLSRRRPLSKDAISCNAQER